jgi:hypothetical protein
VGPWRREDEPTGPLRLARSAAKLAAVEIMNALLLTWSLVPLAAMLIALFTASWLRQGRKEREAALFASRSEA